MKDIMKRIVARLAKTTETSTGRVLEIDTERVVELVASRIQMRTIFPHPAVITSGDSYGDWYARVADCWQRRRQVELQDAPTSDLQRIIDSVMRSRIETAQESCTTLH